MYTREEESCMLEESCVMKILAMLVTLELH